jgi:hypothetical protein
MGSRQVAWIPPTGDDDLMVAARSGDCMEAGQAIREHLAAVARCSLAQAPFATELKPLTAVILA